MTAFAKGAFIGDVQDESSAEDLGFGKKGHFALRASWPVVNSLVPNAHHFIVASGVALPARLTNERVEYGNVDVSPDYVTASTLLFAAKRASTDFAEPIDRPSTVPVTVSPEAEPPLRQERVFGDALFFARTIGMLMPHVRRITVRAVQDPDLGYIVPTFEVTTDASVEEVAANEDRLHEQLFKTTLYRRFDEVAITYRFQ